jgi:cyanophycin synthetase
MQIRKVLTLRGPNIWANFPVIEAWVDLAEWKDRSSETIPGFNDRLMSWLPGMIEHQCSEGERGGFFARLRRGTYMAHILEHVTLELQSQAGVDVSYGRAREMSEEGVYKVVFKYRDEDLGRESLKAARDLIMAAALDEPFDVVGTIERLRELAEENLLGPSTNSIVQAARRRNIPWRRLNRHSLIQLGYGAKLRRIRAAESDQTGSIAEAIAQDKQLTRTLLEAAGVPVARGYAVKDENDAWETAQWMGMPVVVKPQDGNQGRGVATNLTSEEQVRAAYRAALEEGDAVLVERYAAGDDYRLLVIGGKLVAASRREPAHVIGDGVHTVQQLIDVANLDPRRADHHSNVLSRIKVDDVAQIVLKDQGLTQDSVPAKGRTVLIRRNANLSTGGTATDVTDEVHPEVVARAIEAAKVVGLDIAGIDVIAQDITRPLEEQGGIIVEVNAAPGLRMHMSPSEGRPRDVGAAIVDMMFPKGENGRIPIAAVTGINGKTTVTRFIAHILRGESDTVGMTCTDGIYINDRRIDSDDCSGPVSAGMVLMNPKVEMAVFETARGGILRAGLAFNECKVAVVTNIGDGDHLGLNDINSVEDLAKVKRTIVDVVARDGYAVLNATDPLVVEMAPHCPGQVLFFAIDGTQPVMAAHRKRGGATIFVRNGSIVLAHGSREDELVDLNDLPLTYGGRISFEVENALAALGAGWAMGMRRSTLTSRAMSFSTDMNKVPGRFNVVDVRGGKVVVDYGHNAHSLRAMIDAMEIFPHRRRIATYSMAGDRRDCDLIHIGELLGDAFDHVILYEAHSVRGRAPGEISALMRIGLDRGHRVRRIEEIEGAIPAMEYSLNLVRAGDLMLMQADEIDESVDFVRAYVGRAKPMPAVTPHLLVPRFTPNEAPSPSLLRVIRAEAASCAGVLAHAPLGAKAW